MSLKHKSPGVIRIFKPSFALIAYSFPFMRNGHHKRHFSFKVRLIKDREDLVAIECFELCVQVLASILSINIAVQAYSV